MSLLPLYRPLALLASMAALLLASCTPRVEASMEPFTPERFAELQAQDALILVDVSAPWCGTCVLQGEILATYQAQKPDAPLSILRIDFDSQKQALAALRAPGQSTLVLFRGDREVWRSIGETRPEVIVAALDRGVSSL
ncbi:MAG TPA: thioredoxin family protein [Myxococcota bacterium]|nr:thioredoxin family protein [Myxococcota bacterium]